jgi:hypothetical protein
MNTINNHMSGYWLQAMHQSVATMHRLRAAKMPLPPNFSTIHERAITNFANCAVGHTFREFAPAQAFAIELSMLAPGKIIAVVSLIMSDFRSDQTKEYVVYPDSSIPATPGYITVDVLARFASPTGRQL